MRTEYKGYLLTPDKISPTLVRISTVGKGGKIPDSLSGLYTTRTSGHLAIDYYLNSKEKRLSKNAETVSESGD